MKPNRILKLLASAGVVSCLTVGTAYGSAFQLFDQDGSQLGNSYAGSIASADTPGTEFYNPAGMTHLKHIEMSFGATAIDTNIAFTGHTSVTANNVTVSTRDETAQAGGLSTIPNFHLVVPFATDWAWGFGISVPFGLETDYPDYSVAANAATMTSLRAINAGTSLAYQVNNWFSIAAGLDEQKATGIFDQTPTVDVVVTNHLHNQLSDYAMGWHAGVLFDLTKHARIGVNYRSKVNHKPTGNSKSVTDGLIINENDIVSTQIVLPATTSIGFYDDLNQKWSVMAKADYTQWASIPSIVLNNVDAGPGIGNVNIVLPEDFKDTWNFSIGANYHISPIWIWKMGMGLDQSPVRAADRNLRLPDNDHYVVSTGIEYKANDNFTMDMGYEHVFVKDAPINNDATSVHSTINLLVKEEGDVKASADIIGAQITWKFM